MDQKQFERLTIACDIVLEKFSANYAIVAIPWLHVLNAHPNSLVKYQHVFAKRNWVSFMTRILYSKMYMLYQLFNSFFTFRLQAKEKQSTKKVDILFISHFVNGSASKDNTDFYFGDLPSEFQKKYGLQSVIGLIDHTPKIKNSASRLIIEEGAMAKWLFPKTLSFSEELTLIYQTISSFFTLFKSFITEKNTDLKAVLLEAAIESVSPKTFKELRIHHNVRTLIKMLNPKILIFTWEGWAWERLSIRSAKTVNPELKCFGYQHTVLYASSHSIKKSLGSFYDPDMIFTIGNWTTNFLKTANQFKNTAIINYGSQRLLQTPKEVYHRFEKRICLVAPEGIESECLLLFEFAIELATQMPEIQFLFRTHPVLPFSMLSKKNTSLNVLPANCIISDEKDINADFAKCNFLLYRGSSVALYAVLNGVRPFYYHIQNEISIDPLYELKDWRITVKNSDEFKIAVMNESGFSVEEKQNQFLSALTFCKSYVSSADISVFEGYIR